MKDPVDIDLNRHLAAEDKATQTYEDALVTARAEFRIGELNDYIIDAVADDTGRYIGILLHAAYPEIFAEDSCAMRDFWATVEGIIQDKAKRITEDELWENHRGTV